MLAASVARLEDVLKEDDVVLDVGGAFKPLNRADWVVDLLPYEERGAQGSIGPGPERFGPDTWVQRDICDREPLPFADGSIDFAVCSQTLEDLRDPIWVCSELVRVAKAGYIEVPSRLEEQTYGVIGAFVGWSHHHWLVEIAGDRIEFVYKQHAIHGDPGFSFPAGFADTLTDEERVQTLWWEGSFEYGERFLSGAEETHAYLGKLVARHRDRPGARPPLSRRVLRRLRLG